MAERYLSSNELMNNLNLVAARDPRFRLNYAEKKEVKKIALQYMQDVYDKIANIFEYIQNFFSLFINPHSFYLKTYLS